MADAECPYCGETAVDIEAEIIHMQAKHPEIIEQRLQKAGFRKRDDGTYEDLLAGEDT